MEMHGSWFPISVCIGFILAWTLSIGGNNAQVPYTAPDAPTSTCSVNSESTSTISFNGVLTIIGFVLLLIYGVVTWYIKKVKKAKKIALKKLSEEIIAQARREDEKIKKFTKKTKKGVRTWKKQH